MRNCRPHRLSTPAFWCHLSFRAQRAIFGLQVGFVSLGLLSLAALTIALPCFAQGAHPAAPPPPPGVKKITCTNRPVPQLEDVTGKAGIHFRHVHSPEKRYIIESMSGGVILIDYDRDGWPDIYFTNAPTFEMTRKRQPAYGALYHNNHDGTFTDVTEKSGLGNAGFAMGGAVGDFDNDGWPDLYVTALGGNRLFHNNGDGTFTDVTAKAGVADGRWSTGAAFGDYDGDGYLDLMVANYIDFDLANPPHFGESPTCKYKGMDVQCGPRGLKGAGDSLFHNNGDGTFINVSKDAGVEDAAGYYGLSVIWADFNNTGRPDIYVADDSTPKYLYRNDGKGKFKDISYESGAAVSEDGLEQGSMGIAIGDYLHNGRPSLYVTNFADEYNVLYRNDGNWDFHDVSYQSGIALPALPWVKWGTAFADIDNDGWLDLLAVNGHVYPQVDKLPANAGYREPSNLFLNQTDGTFCDASAQAGPALMQPRVSRGLAVGDLFNDGQMDAVIEDLDGAPVILRNQGISGRHWASFELAGTKSNRLAIGAKLKIAGGGMTQTEEIHSGGSYLSQNDLRVHFGLGDAKKIDLLEIRWPSGATDVIKDIPADQFYSVLEGKGIVSRDQILPMPLARNRRK